MNGMQLMQQRQPAGQVVPQALGVRGPMGAAAATLGAPSRFQSVGILANPDPVFDPNSGTYLVDDSPDAMMARYLLALQTCQAQTSDPTTSAVCGQVIPIIEQAQAELAAMRLETEGWRARYRYQTFIMLLSQAMTLLRQMFPAPLTTKEELFDYAAALLARSYAEGTEERDDLMVPYDPQHEWDRQQMTPAFRRSMDAGSPASAGGFPWLPVGGAILGTIVLMKLLGKK